MERIHEVEIPTGLPLVFNIRKKCIQLLEDGDENTLESLDPLSRYVTATTIAIIISSLT